MFTLAILYAFPSIGVAQFSVQRDLIPPRTVGAEPLPERIRKAILAEPDIEIQFEDLGRFGFPLYLLAELDEEYLTALRSEDAVTRRRAARAISLLGPSGKKYLDDLCRGQARVAAKSPD